MRNTNSFFKPPIAFTENIISLLAFHGVIYETMCYRYYRDMNIIKQVVEITCLVNPPHKLRT